MANENMSERELAELVAGSLSTLNEPANGELERPIEAIAQELGIEAPEDLSARVAGEGEYLTDSTLVVVNVDGRKFLLRVQEVR